MKLDVIIEGTTFPVEVPAALLDEAEEFFQKMDRDMDAGWQMGTEFVENPNRTQRCQIAANKLLTSHAAENDLMIQLMSGYILKRMPGIQAVRIDTDGDMAATELVLGGGRADIQAPRRLTEAEARERADHDVSAVYKVGRAWRFAVHDRATGRWVESPFAETETDATRMRNEAHARLVAKLTGV